MTTRVGLNLAAARFVRRGVVRVAQEHLQLDRYTPDIRAAFDQAYPASTPS